MTREQAHRILSEGLLNAPSEHEWCSAFKMAIKALEQEPYDAVSRAKTIEICKSRGHDNSAHYISELPPITPQQKTGHWERVTDNAGYLVWECDKCKWQQRYATNYCPDCGATMMNTI